MKVRLSHPEQHRGTLVTDRSTSSDAEKLAGVEQHKCLSHLIRTVTEVVATKRGSAKVFGSQFKRLLRSANDLRRQQRASEASGYAEARRTDQAGTDVPVASPKVARSPRQRLGLAHVESKTQGPKDLANSTEVAYS
jgi:hypothetical protein